MLIGDEPHLPYNRPPLSKQFLTSDAGVESILLARDAAIAELELDLRLGTRATGLDLGARSLTLGSGERVRFDALVVATGSRARTLAGPESLAGVHTLRTLDDAVAIRDEFAGNPRLVVIGGGFVGAEIASTARKLGLAVTIVDPLPTLMFRGLGPVLGDLLARVHRDNGVALRLGVGVERLLGQPRVQGVELADGSVLPADLVVLGIGAVPDTQWLAGSGLQLQDGIVCDEFLRAQNASDVYAVGDVASWHNPRYGERMRIEHWTGVGEQAAAVAATLAGSPTPCDLLPYVWSDQFGVRLQICGRVRDRDELVFVHGAGGEHEFVAVTGGDGLLQAAVGRGALKELLPYTKQLRDRAAWTAVPT